MQKAHCLFKTQGAAIEKLKLSCVSVCLAAGRGLAVVVTGGSGRLINSPRPTEHAPWDEVVCGGVHVQGRSS
jgi:hypothetical protein